MDWQFWIDRGGTFTDIVARRPARLVADALAMTTVFIHGLAGVLSA